MCHMYPPKELGPYLPAGGLKLVLREKGEGEKKLLTGLYSLPTAAMPLSVLCQTLADSELQLEIMGPSEDLATFAL